MKRRRTLARHSTLHFRWSSGLLLLITILNLVEAQEGRKCIEVAGAKNKIQLDSLIIDPASITISDTTISYEYNAANHTIFLSNNAQRKATICFSTINSVLYKPIKNWDISLYERGRVSFYQDKYREVVQDAQLFETPGLYKAGTISRGITVGNRQNLFVNSSLNLQLSGKLSDDLNIDAVITDQNIPYQPEGNTQQIRDFDNVYIQLYNENIDLLAGDIVLQNPDDRYFLQYYKNQQGIQLAYRDTLKNGWISKSKASAAFAKGKFASLLVPPIEGVSGPYRLRGAQNERFIIILANSERVFIDGKRLRRGFNNDYIIDYNQGEITFNPNIVITRFTRIRVDFEYTEQTYSRSNILVSQELQKGRVSIYGELYRERDNTNTIPGANLSLSDREYLSTIGDDLERAFISGIDQVPFAENRILYIQTDTIVDDIQYEIYERTVSPTDSALAITFTEVGAGNGNYVRTSGSANGRVFRWVAPVNGEPSGNFAPVVPVTTPNLRQMAVIGGEFRLNDHETVRQEIAFSNQDVNLFSPRDDRNNQAMAFITTFESKNRELSFLPQRRLTNKLSIEHNQADFKAIDRFRYIEFDRDWNNFDRQDSVLKSELLLNYELELTGRSAERLSYEFNFRERGDVLQGIQQSLQVNENAGGFNYNGDHFLLQTTQQTVITDWRRSFSDLSYQLHPFRLGGFFNLDQNRISSKQESDSVISTAMYYTEQGAYVANSDTADYQLMLRAGQRSDKLPLDGELEGFTDTRYLSANIDSEFGKNHTVFLSMNYRDIEDLQLEENSRSIIQGKLIAENNFLGNMIRSNLLYGSANSRELRREFVYTIVGAGQGTHTWRDENGDGVQDLNEFYEAINPDERDFIKLFVPTDEYVEAFQLQYNHSLNIKMPASWRNAGFLKNQLSKLSLLANWNINRKTTSGENNQRLNPFQALPDSTLLFENSIKRYNIFYNRLSGDLGLNFSLVDRDSKQLNQNGFEFQGSESYGTDVRWNISSSYQFFIKYEFVQRINSSDFLESRNFELNESMFSPELLWQPTTKFRLGGSYKYSNSREVSVPEDAIFSKINEYTAKATYSNSQKGLLNVEFSMVDIAFDGVEDSYLGYVLLEALQPGRNFRVSTNWQQNLRDGLQLTLQYFGRKSENEEMIHSGTVQLTAFF